MSVVQAQSLAPSPLHDRTAEHCFTNAWTRVGQMTLVDVYTAVEEEYWAAHVDAGLFDLSYTATLRLKGHEARAAIEHLISGRTAELAPGGTMRALLCNDTGHVVADGELLCEAPDSFLLASREPCRAFVEDALDDYACTVADLSADVALLGLRGPAAAAVLESAGFAIAAQLAPDTHTHWTARGLALGVARAKANAYTLWTAAPQGRVLWDRLMRGGAPLGLKPAGIAAQTALRLEGGTPALGIDYQSAPRARVWQDAVTPAAVGLADLVDLGKPSFIGRAALAAAPPLARRLTWLTVETTMPVKGAVIAADKAAVGYVTSAAWSPRLGATLALGWIEGETVSPALDLFLPPDTTTRGKQHKVGCTIKAGT